MGLNWDEESTSTVAQNAPAPAKKAEIDFSKIDINDIQLGGNVDWDNMICDSCQ